jgi:hypothetical protein
MFDNRIVFGDAQFYPTTTTTTTNRTLKPPGLFVYTFQGHEDLKDKNKEEDKVRRWVKR